MKNITSITTGLLAATLLLPSTLSLVGCGDETAPAKEDPKKTAERVEIVTKQAELVEKYQGNYDAMTTEDKAKATELFGSEANARTGFSKMGRNNASGSAAARPAGQ